MLHLRQVADFLPESAKSNMRGQGPEAFAECGANVLSSCITYARRSATIVTAGTGREPCQEKMRDGFQFQSRRRSVPDRVSRVAQRQQAVRAAYGRDHHRDGRGSRRIRPAEALGQEDGRGQVARAELAQAIRRSPRGNPAEYR